MDEEPVLEYLRGAADRLAGDGCEVRTEQLNGRAVTIGYRSDFRLRWMATKLHLFTVIAAVPMVRQPDLEAFTDIVFDYVDERKGQLRGMQTGIAVFPCMVSTRVDPAATAWAEAQQRTRFAMLARPVLVDAFASRAACFRGTPTLGFIYAGHLRQKLATYFPA